MIVFQNQRAWKLKQDCDRTTKIGRDIMNVENISDLLIIFLGVCLALVFIAILLVKLIVSVYIPFSQERDFIRSKIMWTYGEKKAHWKREMRRLYLEQIPVIGEILADKSRRAEKRRRM